MKTAILEPHPDDAALFCSFTALRESEEGALIVGIYDFEDERREEAACAANVLSCGYANLGLARDVDTEEIVSRLQWLQVERIFAPARHVGGHPDHNRVCDAATETGKLVASYTSYVNCGDRVLKGREVGYKPAWVPLKLKALLCFASQTAHDSAAQHFLRDQREFYA